MKTQYVIIRADRLSGRKVGHPDQPAAQKLSGAITGDSIMKTCSKCKKTKHISKYSKNIAESEGLQHWCKLCVRKHQSGKGRAVYNTYQRKYQKTRLKQSCAYQAVYRAIKAGELPHPKTLFCSKLGCFSQAKQYHHHKGYTKEDYLTVESLCIKCHKSSEGNERNQQIKALAKVKEKYE